MMNAQTLDPPFPMENGKIFYAEVIQVDDSASFLFKRAVSFIEAQKYTRSVSIRAKNGGIINQTIIAKDNLDKDKSKGKISGNAFYPIEYGSRDFFTFNFEYKILVKDQKYKYELSNFYIVEYVSAAASSVRATSVVSYGEVYSGADIRFYELEIFSKKSTYITKTHTLAMGIVNSFIENLELCMRGICEEEEENW